MTVAHSRPPLTVMKSTLLLPALVAIPLICGGCVGLEAGSRYPNYNSSKVQKLLLSPENQKNPSLSVGAFKVAQEACEGVDTHTITGRLAQGDLARFLESQGGVTAQVKARGNLYWFDFPGSDAEEGDVVRLRLAVLGDAREAADELHKSLLDHGPGWWGLRRSNLSVLAPRGSTGEAVAFALEHKLACWGMMSFAGTDDVFVVPGPYMEL
jgi:hypothetical protein